MAVETQTAAIPADNLTAPAAPLTEQISIQTQFNGTSHDRVYNNNNGILIANQTLTVTTASPVMANPNARGVAIFANVTGTPGGTGPTLTVQLQVQDPASGNWFTISNFVAITVAGTYAYLVYPGATAGTWTAVLSSTITRSWRVLATLGGTTPSFVASVAYSLIV